MIDFPNSPTLNQQFTAAGVTWVWDGTKWVATGLSGGAYLPLAGGTLSGNLGIQPASGNSILTLNKSVSGIADQIIGQTAGSRRWVMALGNGTTESGSNIGSDFTITRSDNTGVVIDTPLTITRSNGVAAFSQPPTAPTPAWGTNSNQLATMFAVHNEIPPGRNKIINGGFLIDQWNNRALVTPVQLQFICDRWQGMLTQPGKFTTQLNAWGLGLYPQAGGCIILKSTSAYTPLATDYFAIKQTIEFSNICDLQFGNPSPNPLCLSFWFWSSVTGGYYGGSITNASGTRSYPFTFGPVTSGWNKWYIVVPGDTTGTWYSAWNAAGVVVYFDLGSGSNFRAPGGAWIAGNYVGATGDTSLVATSGAEIDITNVQVELGQYPSPFEFRPYQQEFALCQRYYQAGNVQLLNYSGVASQLCNVVMIPLPVVMRAQPTLTANWSTQTNGTGSLTPVSSAYYQVAATAVAAGIVNVAGTFTANAEL